MHRCMSIIATDILADLCGLSLGLIVLLLPVGLLLWLLGWWSHRFWIVLGTTVLAVHRRLRPFGSTELAGFEADPCRGAPRGCRRRLGAGSRARHHLRSRWRGNGLSRADDLPVLQPPYALFSSGRLGLSALLLFQAGGHAFMFMTSLLGSSLLAYVILALLNYNESIDAVAWAGANSLLLTILCSVATVAGFACQFFFDRWRSRQAAKRARDILTTIPSAKSAWAAKTQKKAAWTACAR